LGAEANMDDVTGAWTSGIPGAVRFLGKSLWSVPKGPGGLILHDSPPPRSPVKLRAPITDWAHTANMLTLLAKADMRLKSFVGA